MGYLNNIGYLDLDKNIQNKTRFKSNSFGEFIIIGYESSKSIEVEFVNTKYTGLFELSKIRVGGLSDKFVPTLFDVGILGGKYSTRLNNKSKYEYVLWRNMLMRCYDKKLHKTLTTYKECEASKNFKYYDYFHNWCHQQIGFRSFDDEGNTFHIDKDLLCKGNKLYSEDTCIFLPREVNIALTKREKLRGTSPLGVSFNTQNKMFRARISRNKGVESVLGDFDTEFEAFNVYKQAKESYLKQLAIKWCGKIDPRAYEALMNYQVEITD